MIFGLSVPAASACCTIRRVASTPSMTGMRRSISITSGRRSTARATAAFPVAGLSREFQSAWLSTSMRIPARNRGWSSTSATVMRAPASATVVRLPVRPLPAGAGRAGSAGRASRPNSPKVLRGFGAGCFVRALGCPGAVGDEDRHPELFAVRAGRQPAAGQMGAFAHTGEAPAHPGSAAGSGASSWPAGATAGGHMQGQPRAAPVKVQPHGGAAAAMFQGVGQAFLDDPEYGELLPGGELAGVPDSLCWIFRLPAACLRRGPGRR